MRKQTTTRGPPCVSVNATSDKVITGRDQLLCRLHDQLDCRATTGEEHAFSKERQTMCETAEILSMIRKRYPKNKILLLWDGAGWHRGSVAQQAITTHDIKQVYFPPYSPELNPQEHVWKKGRSQVTHNRFIPKIEPVTDACQPLRGTKFG